MFFSTRQNGSVAKHLCFCKGSRGFSLIELLTVVAIIAALAAIALPTYNHYVDKARKTLAYGTLDTMRKAFELYNIERQKYPPQPIDFTTTGQDGDGITVFDNRMLEQIRDDLSSVDSYISSVSTYTLVARAKDSQQTVMTLTPSQITKAP